MAVDALKQIWPEWQIEDKPLGRGSFGVVYKAVRRDHNVESHAAIKVISIPSDAGEISSLRSEGLDMDATRTYLQGVVNDFVSEIQLMESLKGNQNIVSVEDYKVVEKDREIGWDIYIRMELLTPFYSYISDKKMTEDEVIKLGCDICTALEICGKRNIIHRDIKPENIFVNDFGYFKLGDFGIARKMENLTGGLSQKGTLNYIAPEVVNSSEYDARVDIYSLGIVLYRLLNNNRLPFMDTQKQLLNPYERKNAVERRLKGELIPAPCDASPAMADLILRACAFDPNQRFASAADMKWALTSVLNGTYQTAADEKMDPTVSVNRPKEKTEQQPAREPDRPNQFGPAPKKNGLTKIIAAVLAVVLLMGTGIFAGYRLAGGKDDNGVNGSNVSNGVDSDDKTNAPGDTGGEGDKGTDRPTNPNPGLGSMEIAGGSNQNEAQAVPSETKLYGTVRDGNRYYYSFTTGEDPDTTYLLSVVNKTGGGTHLTVYVQDEFGKRLGTILADSTGTAASLATDQLLPNTTYYMQIFASDRWRNPVDEKVDYMMILRDSSAETFMCSMLGADGNSSGTPGTNQDDALWIPNNEKLSGTVKDNIGLWFAFTAGTAEGEYRFVTIDQTVDTHLTLYLYDEAGNRLATSLADGTGTASTLSYDKLLPYATYYMRIFASDRWQNPVDEKVDYTLTIVEPNAA